MFETIVFFAALVVCWYLNRILGRVTQIRDHLQKVELRASETQTYIQSMQNSIRNIEILAETSNIKSQRKFD